MIIIFDNVLMKHHEFALARVSFTGAACVAGLRFLVRICTDLGLKEAGDYAVELKRAEKYKEMREERLKSGRPGSEWRTELSSSYQEGSQQGCCSCYFSVRCALHANRPPGLRGPLSHQRDHTW